MMIQKDTRSFVFDGHPLGQGLSPGLNQVVVNPDFQTMGLIRAETLLDMSTEQDRFQGVTWMREWQQKLHPPAQSGAGDSQVSATEARTRAAASVTCRIMGNSVRDGSRVSF